VNQPRILVAGIGNVFKGDDGFGVEVAHALSRCTLPADVDVVDFGIRGIDLAFAITGGCETVILIDALQRNGKPGTVCVIQPDEADLHGSAVAVQGHNLDPLSVLRWASEMVDELPTVYVVGCEPAEVPDENDLAEGLSPPVQAAVGTAVELIRQLIAQPESDVPATGRSERSGRRRAIGKAS
jgi:hydrogenase maturation protease